LNGACCSETEIALKQNEDGAGKIFN
jgi:hypothetical protein